MVRRGLDRIGARVAERTARLAAGLREDGFELVHESFFDTIELRAAGRAEEIVQKVGEAGWLLHSLMLTPSISAWTRP